MAAAAPGLRPDFGSSGAFPELILISCDTFWSSTDGRRCTLEIFWARGSGNIARVKQFAEVLQPDGTISSNEIQNPVTCRLPDDSTEYMLEFIQNFTENKTTNGYLHVASTPNPGLPDVPDQEPLQQGYPSRVEPEPTATAHLPDRPRSERSPSPPSEPAHTHSTGQGPSTDELVEEEQNTVRQKKAVNGFDLYEVSKYFHLPIHEAAAKLSVGETWLKQKCRDSGIRRWPYRKVKSMDKIIHRLKVQITDGAGTLSDAQMRHLHDQVHEAEAKRNQLCLDAISGALEEAGSSLNTVNESPGMRPSSTTPESASALTPYNELPILKRIKTECASSPKRSSFANHISTPKSTTLSTPPKPMHNSFPGLLEGNLEGFLSSPAALRLASVVTPNRAGLLTPHFLGSPLKFNPDFNFA